MESAPSRSDALHGRTVARAFADSVTRAEEALTREGFGVLCRIDVAAKLKEKLGVEMPPYLILGACLPAMAHRAIAADPEIGIMLPCNVVLREIEPGRTRVEVVNTDAMVRMFDGPGLDDVAREVGARLERVLEAV